jgi:hypothetical protein
MQVCNITFVTRDTKNGGEQVLFSNPKMDVTVAEIALLRSIHGAHAVVDIRPTINDKRSHALELARLTKRYGEKAIEKAWPGAVKRLPVQLIEIGEDVHELMEAMDEPEAAAEGFEPVPAPATRPVLATRAATAQKRHKSKSKAPKVKRKRGQYGLADDDDDVPVTDNLVGGGTSLQAQPAA